MHAGEIIIPLVFFASIFGVFYLYFTARHKERMFLIEKGADASLFYSKHGQDRRKSLSWWTLKLALFLIGIGFGILAGNILAVTTNLQEEVCYFTSIFVFGGVGLLVYYLYEKNSLKEEE